jgi:hypothetical protein
MYLFHYKGNVLVEPVKVTHAVLQFDITGLDTVQFPFQNGSFTFLVQCQHFVGLWGRTGIRVVSVILNLSS